MKSLKLENWLNLFIIILYVNKKMLLLRKKTNLALDLFFSIIFTIKLINVLLANINKTFLIADIDYISSSISLIINLLLVYFYYKSFIKFK